MQRKVVQIARKYLDKGYDDNQTEIMYLGPWNVLGWYDTDEKIRAFAKEVIEVIKGVGYEDCIICPTKAEAKRIILDIMPGELGNPDNEEANDLANYNADYLIKKLHDITSDHTLWRGRPIEE